MDEGFAIALQRPVNETVGAAVASRVWVMAKRAPGLHSPSGVWAEADLPARDVSQNPGRVAPLSPALWN